MPQNARALKRSRDYPRDLAQRGSFTHAPKRSGIETGLAFAAGNLGRATWLSLMPQNARALKRTFLSDEASMV